MYVKPVFLSACAAAAMIGAVAGATINTQPIQRAGIGSDEIVRPAIAFDPTDNGQGGPSLPDQYAMVTPEGVIPVAALATRGIYAQRRSDWNEPVYLPEPVRYFPASDQPAAEPDPMDAVIEVDSGLDDTAAPAIAGEARVINVAETLASEG